MLDDHLARLEIDEWRDGLRAEGVRICKSARDRTLGVAGAKIESLSDKDLFLPKSKGWADVQGAVRSDINMLSQRLSRLLEESYRDSFGRIEALADEQAGMTPQMLYLGGAVAGAGSIGLAMGVGALATTTVTGTAWFGFVSLAPVTVISWPIAATVGVSALSLALLSPAARQWAKRKQRERLLTQTAKSLDRYMVDRQSDEASLGKFLKAVDQIAAARKGHLGG